MAVEWAEDYIKDAVKDLPYASIIVAGVSLVLPLLKNPTAVEAANQDGFIYVTSQMRYYAAIESLLLPKDMEPDLKADLTERLVDLYKLIIDFQVQSVIRFYRSRTKNFFRGTINYDGWDKKLQDIKDGDAALFLKFERAMSGSSLQELRKLAQEAEESRRVLDNLLITAQEHLEVSRDQLAVLQEIERHLSDPQTQTCLQDLRTTDPRDDKKRIEETKGGLLEDSYRWILGNADFRQWRDDQQSRLLWIKGDPGKGKTMLICGIIDELKKSTADAGLLSFFFCQGTDSRINNATAVLRGLIYLLVDEQPSLILHVRKKYDRAGKALFTDSNAWFALSEIFTSILQDPSLKSTYFIVDALDECEDLEKLLDFIVQSSSLLTHIKWLLSSRNRLNVKQELRDVRMRLSLELKENAEQVSDAVGVYIDHRLSRLESLQDDYNFRDQVREILRQKAQGTFLWVALVVQELEKPESWNVLQVVKDVPTGLDEYYDRMVSQIQLQKRSAESCWRILTTALVAYRPLLLAEITALSKLSGLPEEISSRTKIVEKIVAMCGSFLTIRDDRVYLVHQSAKDYLNLPLWSPEGPPRHVLSIARPHVRDLTTRHLPPMPSGIPHRPSQTA